eukprot:8222077-Pyramimonas_sp.AAC.1
MYVPGGASAAMPVGASSRRPGRNSGVGAGVQVVAGGAGGARVGALALGPKNWTCSSLNSRPSASR